MLLSKSRKRDCIFLFLLLFVTLSFFQNVSAQGTITGFVFDNHRNPLPEVDVELLNDFYQQKGRTRTDGTGRYQFSGLTDGNYTVKVMPFRYDLMDQSKLVVVSTINMRGGQGTGYFNEDFYLMPKKGSLAEAELGVVFAQEVPQEARRIFEQAARDISRNRRDEGIVALREALRIFPTYYLALHQLGKELFIKGEYGEAAPLLLKAAEVNPKSPTTYYYLGNSLHKLNYNKAAITALKQANLLAPASTQVLYVLGKAERLEGRFEDAEKHLLEAKRLSNIPVPDIHWELAELYGKYLKKFKEAANELEQYLKAGRYDDEYVKKVKKLIAELQEKARDQAAKS